MPKSVVNAYAGLLLEVREAHVAAIPAAAMSNVPKPTDAQLHAFYAAHPTLYALPERRVIEYVVYNKAKFIGAGKLTDADIAAAYNRDKAKYTPHEARAITQLVIPDEAKARAAFAKAKAGTPLAQAAKADGFESVTFAAQDKATFTNNAAPDIADLAFKTPAGTLAPLTKSALGWYIVRVDSVTRDPGKSLDAARPEITKALQPVVTERIERAFAEFQNKLQDKVTAGATVSDLAKLGGGTVVVTPPLIADGHAVDQPGYLPNPDLAPLLRDAFKPDSKVSSEPLITGFGKTRDQFAMYHVAKILPSGPLPFAKVSEKVAVDALLDTQAKAAHKLAQDVVDKVNHGTSLAAAIQATGLHLPPVSPIKVSKLQLQMMAQRAQQPIPPALLGVFTARVHVAKLVAAPANQGWSIVWVDSKTPGDASTQPQFVAQVQQQLAQGYGQELGSEFAVGAQQALGAKKYPANIAKMTSAMLGNAGQ